MNEVQIDVENRGVSALSAPLSAPSKPCRRGTTAHERTLSLADSSQGMRARSWAPTFSIGC